MTGSDLHTSFDTVEDESRIPRTQSRALGTVLRRDTAVAALRAAYFLTLSALLAGFIIGTPLRYRSLASGVIGLSLAENRSGEVVFRLNPSGPAQMAGVRPGDRLVEVNGERLAGADALSQALRLVSGSSPSAVELRVITSQGQIRELTVLRGEFPLMEFGISQDLYALVLVSAGVLLVLGFSVPALLIAIRRSDDWMAALVSLTMVLFAVLSSRAAGWALISIELNALVSMATNLAVLLVLLLFPDGQFVPRWTRWFLPLGAVWILIKTMPNPAGTVLVADHLRVVVDAVVFAVGIGSQVYRYKKGTDLADRLQTKWLTFGFAVAFLAQYGYSLPRAHSPVLSGSSETGLAFELVATVLYHLFLLAIPISFTHAVLRHRLFEIDLVLNRTLVYVPLSAILAGVYTASVMLFRTIIVALTGESSDLAVIMSTLVIVAAMTPIKDMLQTSVDRSFKDSALPVRILREFEMQVRERMHAVQAAPIIRRLLEKAAKAFEANGGAAFLNSEDDRRLIHTCGIWTGTGEVEVQVCTPEDCFGSISLEERRAGGAYSRGDLDLLREVAGTVASAIDQDRELAV